MNHHIREHVGLGHDSIHNMVADDYFQWLLEKVEMIKRPIEEQYIHLFHVLDSVDFYSDHPMDINRIEDALSLRDEYDYISGNGRYLGGGASVLEVMIALSMKFHAILYDAEVDDQASDRFWELLDNTGLMLCVDDEYGVGWDEGYVCDIITIILNKEYDRYGSGSFFPVRRSRKDHRKLELWYQMHDYIDEKY